MTIGIIDVFAGPGGLGEGFSSFVASNKTRPFRIAVSAEMERTAHATLRLRSFVRLLRERDGRQPIAYKRFMESIASAQTVSSDGVFSAGQHASLWAEADAEALNLTLGVPEHDELLYSKIEKARRKFDELILIGGPPCQAYSLVGRARQRNVPGFSTLGDKKHFLYLEYLKILARFRPAVFIMENVKGILTSSVGGNLMFDQIRRDLANPGATVGERRRIGEDEYVLLPIHTEAGAHRDPEQIAHDPSGFIIRCEDHGIPQARHRVIIMGVRADIASAALTVPGLPLRDTVPIEDALSGLPRLRSAVSRGPGGGDEWSSVLEAQRKLIIPKIRRDLPEVADLLSRVSFSPNLPRESVQYASAKSAFARSAQGGGDVITSHSARSHMAGDLGRYMFAAAFSAKARRSPKNVEFPAALAPDHANWLSGAFADRFRVQLKRRPSNTVTSHLSKDGHAFIHWDVGQCRSISVREAARLQSFPDDYVFTGNRTQQFVQVGNAVPPMIAVDIARVVWSILGGKR